MPAKLLYRDSQGRDSAVDLVPEGSFVGRGPDCLVRTDDAMVSRKNCKISVLGGRWYVEDMNSANGTFLNDRKLQVKEVLNHNDIIKCGSLQVRFVEMSDASYQQMQGVGSQPVVQPVAQPVARPTHPAPVDEDRKTGMAPSVAHSANGSGSTSPRAVVEQKDDELKKAVEDRDAAKAAAAEAQRVITETGAKLEAATEAQKRLGAELQVTKKALDDLRRQATQREQELNGILKVNEEFRQEQKQLKEQADQARNQIKDLQGQVETKDRQLTAANDDVRRSKQTADALNAKLQESTKAKDDQVRALNDQRGDVEHLREVLKENERIIEERRVALISLQEKVKDLEKRGSAQEKELVTTRTERDSLKQQNTRAQEREVDLRKMLQDSQAGGEQLAQLSRENSKLQEEIERLQGDRKDLQQLVEQARATDQEAQKLRATVAQLTDEKKAFPQRLKDGVEQATRQALDQLKQQMEARFDAERKRLTGERAQQGDDLAAAAGRERAALQQSLEKLTADLGALTRERDELRGRLSAGDKEQADREARSAAGIDRLRAQGEELDGLKRRLGELEGKLTAADRSAAAAVAAQRQAEQTAAEAQRSAADAQQALANAQRSASTPVAAPAAPAGDEARLLTEVKAIAATAYDGINVALSDLRLSIAQCQETFVRMERTLPDRDAARKLRDAIEATMDRADEAKGHVRSLRSVIE